MGYFNLLSLGRSGQEMGGAGESRIAHALSLETTSSFPEGQSPISPYSNIGQNVPPFFKKPGKCDL